MGHRMLAIVVFVAVIAILFIPVIPVKVAYSEIEPYTRNCQYKVVSENLRMSWDIVRGTYYISEITVKNIDSYGGTFKVTHYLYDVHGLYDVKETYEYLAPGETKTFRAEFNTRIFQDVIRKYSVSAPTVIDQRIVTNYKTVHKSIIELLVYS